MSLHFNKGLAGVGAQAAAAACDTSINPAALDAFALAIIAGGRSAKYSLGFAQDEGLPQANRDATEIGLAMSELNKLGSSYGSYVSEGSYFQNRWQETFWGRITCASRRSNPNTIPPACSSFGMAWAAKGGARTDSRELDD